MKKLILFIFSGVLFTFSCQTDKNSEARFVYETDKIVDTETGDEYVLEDDTEAFTVIHSDGTKEKIAFAETPVYGSPLTEEYITEWKNQLALKKEKALEEKKNNLKEARKKRYENLSDEELMRKFQELHKKGLELDVQMDIVGEMVERNTINSNEAPLLLEIDPKSVDFQVELPTDH
jgi:hypothetical protein